MAVKNKNTAKMTLFIHFRVHGHYSAISILSGQCSTIPPDSYRDLTFPLFPHSLLEKKC